MKTPSKAWFQRSAEIEGEAEVGAGASLAAAVGSERLFRRKGGFDGEVKALGFRPDGTVTGYFENGDPDPDPFTGLYSLAYATTQVALGFWEEIVPNAPGQP